MDEVWTERRVCPERQRAFQELFFILERPQTGFGNLSRALLVRSAEVCQYFFEIFLDRAIKNLSSTVEKTQGFWSTAIMDVGPADILSGRRGDTDSLRRACRITARRRDAREPHRLEACAPPHVKLLFHSFTEGGRQTAL